MENSNQRDILDGQAAATLQSLADAVVRFTQVTDFTTFNAEYTLKENDLIIHFFLPPDLKGPSDYWTLHFPKALDFIARSYFEAEAPRLQAKYTPELSSWWFKACGYDHIIDLADFVDQFLSQLDESLDHLLRVRNG